MINYRFILTATLTFIPYTILWFFWHNNIFHKVYYSNPVMNGMGDQNIWAMNFANALFVYGFIYFYYRVIKQDTKIITSILWGTYYNISVIGFFAFMNFGLLAVWPTGILFHDLIWAVLGGIIMGFMTHYIFKRFNRKS